MKRKSLVLVLSLLLVLAWVSFPVPANAAPTIIYVDADAAGSNNGTSWANAYTNLQDALARATAGDRIWVAEGIYKPTMGTDRLFTFTMKDWVEIYGGFDGTEATLSERNPDPASNNTILSGDIGTEGEKSDNVYHVVTAGSSITSSAVLDGFTITKGNANGSSSSYSFGGGMYNRGSSGLKLANCIFSDNSALDNGAGMYNNEIISLTLTNCTFNGNSAGSYGGGMYNNSSSPTLTDCTFSNNSAIKEGGGMSNYQGSNPVLTDCTFSSNSSDRYGGGMYSLYSTPTLTGCTFSGNSAASQGGGMYNFSSSPVLTDCTFSGNSATNPGGDPVFDPQGGGMYNRDSSPVLTDCTFNDNSSDYSGGGMFNLIGSNPTLTGCTFSDNSTAFWGGGMINFSSSPTLTDCTFSGNSVDIGGAGMYGGGGIYNYQGSNTTLTNCTFSGNSVTKGFGGGMGNESSIPIVTDCIFSENFASNFGGGMGNYNGGNPILTDCIFSGNQSNTYGGGMGNYSGGNPILTNCTFSGNLASHGGGMGNKSSNPDLTNCIFSGNSASMLGGGMYSEYDSNPALTNCTISSNLANFDGGGIYNFQNSNPELTNCILWGNEDSGGTDVSAQIYSYIASTAVVNYSCIQGWSGALGGTGNIGDDPLFVNADGDNNVAGDADDNLRLSVGSPCIDTGDNSAVPAGVTTDIDGQSRIINDVVDMGAYEYSRGVINVTSTPSGASFTISGAASYNGTTSWSVSQAPAGEYTIAWGNLEGYTKPSGETKLLVEGGTISFDGVYLEQLGTIDVTSTPSGMSFTLSGAASYSGTTPWSVSDAPVGNYTIAWEVLSGYGTPAAETKTLNNGGSIIFDGNYLQSIGTIDVSSTPDGASFTISGPVGYGGTTSDATPWSVNDAPAGEYTILWGDLDGYITPSGETKELTSGGSISFDGVYVEGSVEVNTINITSTPDGAGFTLSGAASYSGTTPWSMSDAPAGEYTIIWGDLDGYTKPSGETKSLIEGGGISFNGVYVQQVGTINVTSTPEGAGFTISGPANYNGTTPWSVSDAPVGEYILTWDALEGYDTPSSQTLTLEQNGSIAFDDTFNESESGGGGLSGGAIAGIVIGSLAGLAIIFFALRKWVFTG